ncbi:hypothetical protein DERP_005143 [Dermatophagoides pteronyssinus]|uniref:Uncharacterized protein n=1 Tax=Dermatophagoides pteronyssinus TaxID=6956 RepID=A0ABQ8JLS2_DERPT|nr:hypothetical protein DERP_005143 [Dermatophagoides pteronyssinus]
MTKTTSPLENEPNSFEFFLQSSPTTIIRDCQCLKISNVFILIGHNDYDLSSMMVLLLLEYYHPMNYNYWLQ